MNYCLRDWALMLIYPDHKSFFLSLMYFYPDKNR